MYIDLCSALKLKVHFPNNMNTCFLFKINIFRLKLYECKVEVYILNSVCQGLTVMENIMEY